MRGALYLRDARHQEKFIYTLADKLFYDKFERHYEPSDEYLHIVTDLLKDYSDDWTTRRDGFWRYVYPEHFIFPPQGWKTHVSATLENAASILQRTARVVFENNIPFKFALDKRTLTIFNSKRWRRGASGKFITIYPIDISSLRSSCDYATGSAGVMRALHRFAHLEEADFVLDEVALPENVVSFTPGFSPVTDGRYQQKTVSTVFCAFANDTVGSTR